jgi:hypothetical protein
MAFERIADLPSTNASGEIRVDFRKDPCDLDVSLGFLRGKLDYSPSFDLLRPLYFWFVAFRNVKLNQTAHTISFTAVYAWAKPDVLTPCVAYSSSKIITFSMTEDLQRIRQKNQNLLCGS